MMNRIIPDSVFFMLILGGMSGLLICSAQGNQDANEKHDLEHVNMVKEKCGLLPEDMPDFEDFKMEIVKPDDKEDKPERDDDQKNKKSDKKEESVSGAYTNDLPEADDFKIGLNPSDPDDEKEGKKGGKSGKKGGKKGKKLNDDDENKDGLLPDDMPDFEDFKMEIVKPDDKKDKPERDDDQKDKKSDKKEEPDSGAYTNDLPEADDFKIGLNPSDPDDEKEGKKGGKNGKKAVKKRKRAIRMMKTKTALYPTICLILRILKWKS